MKSLMKRALTMTLLSGVFAFGCSSSSSSDDASTAQDAGSDGPALFAITAGNSCFDVVSIQPGSNDGCMLGVADTVANGGPVGGGLLVNYDNNTGILTVGTDGHEGGGPIAFNMGTLTRDNTATDPMMATCTWHQTDTSDVTITATNEFDISVTEVENMFATACSFKPAGGTCTSTWTWHMKIGTEVAPACN